MSGPSEKAEMAARIHWSSDPRDILAAAHDPGLGLDRSVCLRDLLQALDDIGGAAEASHYCAQLQELFAPGTSIYSSLLPSGKMFGIVDKPS